MASWDTKSNPKAAAAAAAAPDSKTPSNKPTASICNPKTNKNLRRACYILPVLFILGCAGAGIAIWQTRGSKPSPKVMTTAGEPLTFSVDVSLPQSGAGGICSGLFYSSGEIKQRSEGAVVSSDRVFEDADVLHSA